MTYRMDDEGREIAGNHEIGPAGVLTAEIGHDFAAEVSIDDGVVVKIVDLGLHTSAGRQQTLRNLVADERALDAIRRIVVSTAIEAEEPHDDERWCVLDRVLARLDLEGAIPVLRVSDLDRELAQATTILRSGSLDISRARAVRVQVLADAIRAKLPTLAGLPTTGELIEANLAALSMTLGEEASVGIAPRHSVVAEPRVVLLSAGPDLSHAMSGSPPRLERIGELDVTLIVPVTRNYPADRIGRLACYLVEPDHPHPIAHVALLTEEFDDQEHSLRANFLIARAADLSEFEFVVLPAGTPDHRIVSPSVARSLLCAEIHVRTAIRLAQRSQRERALECLQESERTFRAVRADVPKHYWDRLFDIRRRIEEDNQHSDLLSDL